MTVKEILGSVGGLLGVGVFVVAAAMLGALFIVGAELVSTKLLPWFAVLAWVALGVVVFVLLPLAIPRATRGFSSVALFIASYVFGVTLWMAGFLLTLSTWGVWAVIIGLFIAGVGVVPIAMLATLTKGMWGPLVTLVLLAMMTFGSRAGAMALADSLES